MAAKTIITATIAIMLTAVILVPACFPQSEDNTLDVVIIDGQSNAQYWGWYTNTICSPTIVNETGLGAPEHKLYYYGDSTPVYYGETYAAATYDTTLESYGIHEMYQDGAWVIGSYGPILAKELSERSGHDVLVIDVGVGAAPISWLSATGPGGVWADKIISDALDKLPENYHIDMLGMVWAQGESDASTAVDTYIDYFYRLYDDFNEKFGLEKVYIIKTRDAYGGNAITAQEQLAEENENIVIATSITDEFTTENGYLKADGIHYTQYGRNVIAEILGESIAFEEHLDGEYFELMKIIPPIIILGILLGVVATVIRNRE